MEYLQQTRIELDFNRVNQISLIFNKQMIPFSFAVIQNLNNFSYIFIIKKNSLQNALKLFNLNVFDNFFAF